MVVVGGGAGAGGTLPVAVALGAVVVVVVAGVAGVAGVAADVEEEEGDPAAKPAAVVLSLRTSLEIWFRKEVVPLEKGTREITENTVQRERCFTLTERSSSQAPRNVSNDVTQGVFLRCC